MLRVNLCTLLFLIFGKVYLKINVLKGKHQDSPETDKSHLVEYINGSQKLVNFKNIKYYGYIYIGTPPQLFSTLFDTSTGLLWVPSSKCDQTKIACKDHRRYDSNKSSSYIPDGRSFQMNYGSGEVEGFYSKDNVEVGGINIPNQLFGEATHMSPTPFDRTKYDGIFGLGFASQAPSGAIPPIYTAYMEKLIKPIFSFYLNRDPSSTEGGELTIGDVNPKYYTGDFHSVPISKEEMWAIKPLSINIKNVYLCPNECTIYIDSSTSMILGKKEIVYQIHKLIEAQEIIPDLFAVNCSKIESLPELVIKFEEFDLILNPSDYIVKQISGDELMCLSGFKVHDMPIIGIDWVFGLNFLGSHYTKFDVDAKTIAFAELAKKI